MTIALISWLVCSGLIGVATVPHLKNDIGTSDEGYGLVAYFIMVAFGPITLAAAIFVAIKRGMLE